MTFRPTCDEIILFFDFNINVATNEIKVNERPKHYRTDVMNKKYI